MSLMSLSTSVPNEDTAETAPAIVAADKSAFAASTLVLSAS